MITKIFEIEVPQRGDSKTTYNVGIIEGGTSVNTIAQSAKMLCEYRSDDVECLEIMRQNFEKILQDALAGICRGIAEEVLQCEVGFQKSSTDCNIPMSMGIPAVCVGVYQGKGAHTREEVIEKAYMEVGLEIGIKIALTLGR